MQPSLALDPDVVRAVDHDLRDAVVREQPLQGAVAHDVVGELAHEALAVLTRDPRLLFQSLADHARDVCLRSRPLEVAREQLAPEIVDQLEVDAVLQLGERVPGGLGDLARRGVR